MWCTCDQIPAEQSLPSSGHPPVVTSSCPPLPPPAIRKSSWLILTPCPPPEYSGSPSALLESRGLKQWAKPSGICFQAAAWPHSTSPVNSLQNLPPPQLRGQSLDHHCLFNQVFTGQAGTQDWSSHLPGEMLPIPMYQSPKGTVCSSCHLTQVLLEIKIPLLSQQGMQLCRTAPARGHGYLSNPSFLGIQENPAFLPVITDPMELESTDFPAAFFFSHPERHLPSQQQDFISLTFVIE